MVVWFNDWTWFNPYCGYIFICLFSQKNEKINVIYNVQQDYIEMGTINGSAEEEESLLPHNLDALLFLFRNG